MTTTPVDRSLIEVVPDAVVLHDAEGAILDVNRRTCESLGADDDVVGRTVWDIAVNPDPASVKARWAGLDPGEMVAELEPVDLAAHVEACWKTVETAEAALAVDTDRTVLADPDRLRQLLENVIRNAVEHGGADVAVRVGGLEDGFFVEDDGPGIPPVDRRSVFEAGYTTGRGGTGLAIVEDLADAQGWAVRLAANEAGGARFEFTGVDEPA